MFPPTFGGTRTFAKLRYCQVLLKIARQRRRRFRNLRIEYLARSYKARRAVYDVRSCHR